MQSTRDSEQGRMPRGKNEKRIEPVLAYQVLCHVKTTT